jgi:hypothetical protein
MTVPAQMLPIESLKLRERTFPYPDLVLAEATLRLSRDGWTKPVVIDKERNVISGQLLIQAAKGLQLHFALTRVSHLEIIK